MKISQSWRYNNQTSQLNKDKWDELEEHGYSSLIIEVDDAKNTKYVINKLTKDYGLSAFSIQEMIDEMFKGFTVIQTVLALIGSIALFVAMVGIINTMYMSIHERTREIGVMRACGATKKSIRRLFIFEAAVIGFLGGVIGVLLTFILRIVGNEVLNNVLSQEGIHASNMIVIPVWLIISIVIFTTLLGTIAGLAPSFRAARMDPVEALRYE